MSTIGHFSESVRLTRVLPPVGPDSLPAMLKSALVADTVRAKSGASRYIREASVAASMIAGVGRS